MPAVLLPWLTALTRIALPVLAVTVVVRCALSLFRTKNEPETWAWLSPGDGIRLPVTHWENIIGRGSGADIDLPLPTISRTHAALIRSENGTWTLHDLAHKDNLFVNGVAVDGMTELRYGDFISVAGNMLELIPLTQEEETEQRAARTVPGRHYRPSRTLFWLTLFTLLMAGQLTLFHWGSEYALPTLFSFGWLLALMWGTWLFSLSLRRKGFEIETLGFFLSAVGLAVILSGTPTDWSKQLLAITIGLAGFFILGWVLRDMRRIKALQWPAVAVGLALLLYVLLFGEEINGAKNWITVMGFSLQPSELVKILFIFAGAAALDRLFTRRNLFSFIVFSAAIVGALALMSDFGTAIIFFACYIVIAYLRSGDLATVALSLSGAALAVLLVLTVKPYIAERFAAWGHVWEFAATSGYQQTRAMVVTASGGMFGLGGGAGWLKQLAAADTDLVFAFICEEWGWLLGLCVLAAIIIAALFAVRSAANARSSYYVIAACATGAMLLFQTILNVGGTYDLLPLTGVTLPFVSNGGTSMIACWWLLAFLKASDTRQNASFAIRLPKRKRKEVRPANEQNQTPYADRDDDSDSFGVGVFNFPHKV